MADKSFDAVQSGQFKREKKTKTMTTFVAAAAVFAQLEQQRCTLTIYECAHLIASSEADFRCISAGSLASTIH